MFCLVEPNLVGKRIEEDTEMVDLFVTKEHQRQHKIHLGKVSRWSTFPSDRQMLGFRMCSTGISHMNCYFTSDAKLAKKSTRLFSVLETCLKLQRGNMDFKPSTSYRYPVIGSSLAVYSPLTWLTTCSES